MCSVVASLTGEMAAQSSAYHAHGTADSDKSCCYSRFVCMIKHHAHLLGSPLDDIKLILLVVFIGRHIGMLHLALMVHINFSPDEKLYDLVMAFVTCNIQCRLAFLCTHKRSRSDEELYILQSFTTLYILLAYNF